MLLEMPLLVCAPVAVVGPNMSSDTTVAGGDLETKQGLEECRTYLPYYIMQEFITPIF